MRGIRLSDASLINTTLIVPWCYFEAPRRAFFFPLSVVLSARLIPVLAVYPSRETKSPPAASDKSTPAFFFFLIECV